MTSRALGRWLLREIHGRTSAPTRRKPRREKPARDFKYRAWIRSLPCAACGSIKYVEAAHTGSDGGAKQKASDYSCVPLCAHCHRVGPHAYHGLNTSAKAFERRHGLNFRELSRRLYAMWKRCGGLVK